MVINRVRSLFGLGLEKVASIIDSNPNYGQILGARLDKPEYNEAEAETGRVSYCRALQLAQKRLARETVDIYDLDDGCEILSCGSTENNRREFEFASRLLKKNGFHNELKNINDFERISVPFCDDFAKYQVCSALKEFLLIRGEVNKSLLHQIINYSVTFLVAIESLKGVRAKLFIVANDHSPMPVAFTMVARLLGMTTLYVQHAEVTEVFPKNDFDFSIFRNTVSRKVYSHLCGGRVNPGICLPRSRGALHRDELLATRMQLGNASENSVVIYPSSVFELDSLVSLVETLQKNVNITKVSIKLHPGFRSPGLLSSMRVELLGAAPDSPHIAVCGNSSVVIELLSKGCLVYQFFRLDNIKADYYGFVGRGLASSLDLESFSERFWRHEESKEFISMLGQYLPELDTVENILEKAREKLFFSNLLQVSRCKGRRDKNALPGYQLLRGLFYLTQSFLKDGGHIYSSGYNDFWVISTMNSYFDTRETALNTVYEHVSMTSCNSVLEFWLNSKKIEWTGFRPSQMELNALLQFVVQFDGEHRALKWMETKLFDLLIRYDDADSLINYLEMVRVFKIEETGINRKVAFVRFIGNNPERASCLMGYFDPRAMDLTRLEHLKLSVQSMIDMEGFLEFQDFRGVQAEFLRALPAIKDEYNRFVGQTYDWLGDRVKYIDVARDNGEAKGFLELVKRKLKMGEGFSFIRLSDGEGYLFREYSSLFTAEDARNRERHWWGGHIPEALRVDVVRAGIEAVKNADVLGIPSVYRFLRDHSDSSTTLAKSLQGRGLLSVLEGMKELDSGKALYADDKANLAIFNKVENIRELCALANKVVIVSSGNAEILRARIGESYEYVVVNIPTHNKTMTNSRYVSESKALPYLFRDVCEKLRTVVSQGDLVLIGAGVAGKFFMNVAKQNSAVGLDLGSVMDQFLEAGIHSLH